MEDPMLARKQRWSHLMIVGAVIASILAAALLSGCSAAKESFEGSAIPPTTDIGYLPTDDGVNRNSPSKSVAGTASQGDVTVALDQVANESAADSSLQDAPRIESMMVRVASLGLEVKNVDEALEQLQNTAKAHDAEITELQAKNAGASSQGAEARQGLDDAYVTLRVPQAKLDALTSDLFKLGTVVSWDTSADDVSEEYVDTSARIRNLKAEETRLLSFFDKAGKISDLLEIEREVTRVRGEIESMQARINYLDRQVERATLNVHISKPGGIIRADESGWSFIDAIAMGFQGAASIVKVLITVLISLTPLIAIGLLIWLLIRTVLRRRRAKRAMAAAVAQGQAGTVKADDEKTGVATQHPPA